MCYNFCMGKNILSNRQKKILYKNAGILIVLMIICAVMVRSGILTGGETLEDLAAKQEQASGSSENTSSPDESSPLQVESLPQDTPDSLPPLPENGSGQPADGTLPSAGPENDAERSTVNHPENNNDLPQEETAMEDRVTYQEGFYYESLSDDIKSRITGISYPADDTSAAISYDTLRYVSVLYCDFDGETRRGELICHKAIAQDLTEIFCSLYEARYPVEKICLVDEYQGDDNLSMEDNNTSCFNYRALPSGRLSNHAYGLAVDLNPLYNPYITTRKDGTVNIAPAKGEAYADRDQTFPYKIDKEDLAYRLFIEHGFTWGGSWRSSKDYQHFEKEI